MVQLLFRQDDENVLCVSMDPKDAVWQVGQLYKVEGALAEKLGRKFVQNPHITLVKKHWPAIRKIGIGVAVLAILGGSGSVFALHTIDGGEPVPAVPAVTHHALPAATSAPSAPVVTTPAPAPAPTPAAAPAVKKTTTKAVPAKTAAAVPAAPAPTPVVTQQATPPAAPAIDEDATPAVDPTGNPAPSPSPEATPPANNVQSQT